MLDKQLWRILLIDDDEEDFLLTRTMLSQAQSRKIKLEWAPTYESGQMLLQNNLYDAVLVDYDLGGKSGIELIQENVSKGHTVPFILYTGRGSYEVDLEALRAGATLYLTKDEAKPLLLERVIRYAIERKQMEEALRVERELLRNIIDNAPIGIAVIEGQDHRFVLTNPTYQKNHYPNTNDMVGKTLQEVFPSQAIKDFDRLLLDVHDNGKPVSLRETEYTEKQSKSWWNTDIIPLADHDESINRILVMAQEVTLEVLARKQVESERALLEGVLQQLPVGIIIADASSERIVAGNEMAREMFTFSGAESGEFWNSLDYGKLNEESQQPLPEEWPLLGSIRKGKVVTGEDIVLTKEDGTRKTYRFSSRPVYDEQGVMIAGVAVFDDITGRLQMQENLAYQALVLENVHDAIYSTNKHHQITTWNPAAEDLYGYTANEALGKTPGELLRTDISEEDRREVFEYLQKVGKITLDLTQYRKDDRAVEIEVTLAPIRNAAGEITGYVSTVHDHTGRRQAEAELWEEQQKFQQLVDSIRDGFFSLDENWCFSYINQRAARAGNLPPHEYIGKNIWEQWPNLIGTDIEYWYRMVMEEKKTARFQTPVLNSDNWVEISVYPLEGGISVFWQDITERKQIEEQLKHQAMVFDNVHDAIIATDRQGIITAWNRAAEEMYGWTQKEALTQNIHDLLHVNVDDKSAARLDNQISKTGSLAEEDIHKTSDGMEIVVDTRVIAIRSDDGEIKGYVTANRNITERKKVERELDETRQKSLQTELRFRTSAENLLDGFAILTAVRETDAEGTPGRIIDFRYEYVNEAGCRLNNRTREEHLGHTLLELLPAHHEGEFFDAYVQVVETGQAMVEEAVYYEDIFGEGERKGRIFDTRAVKLGDGFVITWRDITERVQSEERLRKTLQALQESELRLQMAHESAGLGTWQWSAGDSFAVGSDLFFRVHGLEPSQAGKIELEHYFSLIHPDDVQRVRKVTMAAISGEQDVDIENNEFRIVLPDGSQRWVAVYQRAIRDGSQIKGITGVTWDITAHKMAELAVHRSEQRLRSIIDNMFSFVWLLTPGGILLEVNQAPMHAAGLRYSQVINKPFAEARWWSYSYQSQNRLRHAVAAAAKGEVQRFDLPIWTEPDVLRTVDFMIAPIHDENDNVKFLICSGVDITDRKQVELSLQHYAQRLERSNRDLEEFAFVASHDLKEPLRKVKNFSKHLKHSAAEKLDVDEKDYLNRMENAAERMSQMLSDLLTYSKISTQAESYTAVDLDKVMEEVKADLDVSIERTGAMVEAVGLPVIEADATQMRHLLQNLIGNAIKFHQPGIPPRVKVIGSSRPDCQVQIEIIDNGIGFEQASASKIFHPFQRLVTREDYEGSGIGLAICRKIVERHGGSISAVSIPGEGSTFTVILPCIAAAPSST